MAHGNSRSRRALLISVVLAAVAMLVPPANAQAQATVLRFEFTSSFTDFVPSDECRPDLSATFSGTEVLVGQIVETPPPSSGFKVQGSITSTFTVQYSDGSYGDGESSDRFAAPFAIKGPSQQTATSVATFAHIDTITVYDTSGQVIGTQTFHLTEHITFTNVPPIEGPPGEEDIVRVSFERERLTCNV